MQCQVRSGQQVSGVTWMGSGYQFRWRANCASHASSATADLLPNMARVQGSTWPAWGHVTRDTWRGNTVNTHTVPGCEGDGEHGGHGADGGQGREPGEGAAARHGVRGGHGSVSAVSEQ